MAKRKGIIESLADERPGKIKATPDARPVVSIRPGSPEERAEWQAVADSQGITLHALALYLIRLGVKQIRAGRLEVERETITTERVKMP